MQGWQKGVSGEKGNSWPWDGERASGGERIGSALFALNEVAQEVGHARTGKEGT